MEYGPLGHANAHLSRSCQITDISVTLAPWAKLCQVTPCWICTLFCLSLWTEILSGKASQLWLDFTCCWVYPWGLFEKNVFSHEGLWFEILMQVTPGWDEKPILGGIKYKMYKDKMIKRHNRRGVGAFWLHHWLVSGIKQCCLQSWSILAWTDLSGKEKVMEINLNEIVNYKEGRYFRLGR